MLRPTPWLDAARELYIKSSPPGPLPESPRRPINQIGGKQSARFNRDVTNARSCLRGREGSGYSITSDYGELWVSWVLGGWAGVGAGFEDLRLMRCHLEIPPSPLLLLPLVKRAGNSRETPSVN